jgi:translocator assembly and maintenance protein 41
MLQEYKTLVVETPRCLTMSDSKGQLTTVTKLQQLLEETFPQDEIVYAFGYGSGIFSQSSAATTTHDELSVHKEETKTNTTTGTLIDIILVVRDSYKFHHANYYSFNKDHYVRPVFASDPIARITWWQRHYLQTSYLTNPRIYYIVTPNMKYGVVQLDDLLDDLTHWQYLYLAGRMHKPTLEILNRQVDNEHDRSIVYQQVHQNLPAALSVALLLLQEQNESATSTTLSSLQVYETIAGLSYTGDFRMQAGAEDPQKIQTLVGGPGQVDRFRAMYQKAVNQLEQEGIISISNKNEEWTWDSHNATAIARLWEAVPHSIRRPIGGSTFTAPKTSVEQLQQSLVKVIAPAARYQSIKGLATAGLGKSIAYAVRKLSKGLLKR